MKTTDIISAAEIGAITVIDLRDAAEVQSSGWASGALHIPLPMLANAANPNSPDFNPRLTFDRPIAVYSAAGNRSAKGKKILIELGYRVENIGGFYDWAVAGGAVTR